MLAFSLLLICVSITYCYNTTSHNAFSFTNRPWHRPSGLFLFQVSFSSSPSNLPTLSLELPQHHGRCQHLLLQRPRWHPSPNPILGHQPRHRSSNVVDDTRVMVTLLRPAHRRQNSQPNRPDHCDGTYDSFCDPSRQYNNITAILQSYKRKELLEYMNTCEVPCTTGTFTLS